MSSPRIASFVHLVDLGAIEDSWVVAPTVAPRLRISVVSGEAIPPVLAFLGDQRVLLTLRSLAVFAGRFTLKAALEVVAEGLDSANRQLHSHSG